MADADLSVAVAGKNSKTKRDVVPSSSRSRKSSHTATESAKSDSKFKKTVTPVVGTTDVIGERGDGLFPVDEASSDAAEKLLESMLEDCLSSNSCAQPREQTEVDLQIAGLAERFQSTLDQLDRTSSRLRDVTFDVEQKRLMDLKQGGRMRFQETFNSDSSGVERDVSNNERPVREVYNVDLGHSKASGHRQLLDIVTDAIEGLEQIGERGSEPPARGGGVAEALAAERRRVQSAKAQLADKYPWGGALLERVAAMMQSDDEEVGDAAVEEDEED